MPSFCKIVHSLKGAFLLMCAQQPFKYYFLVRRSKSTFICKITSPLLGKFPIPQRNLGSEHDNLMQHLFYEMHKAINLIHNINTLDLNQFVHVLRMSAVSELYTSHETYGSWEMFNLPLVPLSWLLSSGIVPTSPGIACVQTGTVDFFLLQNKLKLHY